MAVQIDQRENWGLRSDTEQFSNEARLRNGIGFSQPSHSSFSNHVNCFEPCNVRHSPRNEP